MKEYILKASGVIVLAIWSILAIYFFCNASEPNQASIVAMASSLLAVILFIWCGIYGKATKSVIK